jgi:pyruvate dehydrogenase complex dehydrogenase (E1) component
MLYSFSNRRRAKDTIMLILDKYDSNGMTVFVRDEMVFIDPGHEFPQEDIDILMHYAQSVNEELYDLSLGNITEFYRGRGLQRFRV